MPGPHRVPGPPRAALLLLRLLPREHREYVVGDLSEAWADRAARRGRLRASAWFWKQAVASVAAFLLPDGGRPGWSSDARHALRSLRRSPAFTALSVGTLAVGVGALTAAFTVLDQVVLTPLPVRDQDRVVVAWNHHVTRDFPHFPFSLDAYEAVREGVPSLEAVAATPGYGAVEQIVDLPDGTEETLRVARVVGDFFGVLGVRPAAGRVLRGADDRHGGPKVAVVSWEWWTARRGSSRDVLGSALTLAGGSYTVVGVLPRGYDHPRDTDVWVPFRVPFAAEEDIPFAELDLVGRMAGDATPERVGEEIAAVFRARPEELGIYEGAVPVVRSLETVVLGDLRTTLMLLFGGAALVLAVASVNLASLVRVRAVGRAGDVAVRRALGAGGARLAREALAEAAWIGLAGGVLGALAAAVLLRVTLPLAPPGLPRLAGVADPDPTALAVSAGVTALSVLVLAVVPVLRAVRTDPAAALRRGDRSSVGGGAGPLAIVVGLQAAMAVGTAALGILLFRSLVELQGLDPGFRPEGVTLVELDVPWANREVPAGYAGLLDRIDARLEAHPSVRASTALLSPPLVGAGAWALIPRLEGQTPGQAMEENPYVNVEIVRPDYFATLELPVLRGRAPGSGDTPDSEPVLVLNEAAARVLWPGEDPRGKRLAGFEDRWWTVVGVVADGRYQDLFETRPVIYFPVTQMGLFPLSFLAVRVEGDAGFLLPLVRRTLEEVEPRLRPKRAWPLAVRLAEPLARPRFAVVVLGVLAGATLLLAAVGVYGVMAHAVRARRGEMGLRMALGAAPGDVRRLVLGQGMRVAAAGSVVGTLAVLPGAVAVESLLFGVAPSDPWSLAGGVAAVLAVALAACWIPASRAARLHPARVLRGE